MSRSWYLSTLRSVSLRGSASTTTSCSGVLNLTSPAVREIRHHLVELEDLARGGLLDDGAHPLAPLAVGQPDHRHVADPGVRVQQVLDLLGRDVLALADDDVLQTAGEHDVTVVAEVADVAGAEVAVGVEGLGGQRRDRCSPW